MYFTNIIFGSYIIYNILLSLYIVYKEKISLYKNNLNKEIFNVNTQIIKLISEESEFTNLKYKLDCSLLELKRELENLKDEIIKIKTDKEYKNILKKIQTIKRRSLYSYLEFYKKCEIYGYKENEIFDETLNNSLMKLGLDINERDSKVIKKKYRTLAKKYHPDSFIENDSEKFIEITNAYMYLKEKFKFI